MGSGDWGFVNRYQRQGEKLGVLSKDLPRLGCRGSLSMSVRFVTPVSSIGVGGDDHVRRD